VPTLAFLSPVDKNETDVNEICGAKKYFFKKKVKFFL
jgi:hypothetical protein